MQPSSRTPEGDDNQCQICGHDARIEPTRPPGDATCPHCGSLIWFPSESPDTSTDVVAARQWERATAAIEANDLRLAERILRMALTADPSNAEFKKTIEELKTRRRAEKDERRPRKRRSQRT